MVEKINKKHCSHDAYKQWEQLFYLIFFYHYFNIIIYFFNNTQGTTCIKIYNTKMTVKRIK